MANYTVRRSIGMTPEMRDLLAQIVSKQPRDVTEADVIRDAIRQYIDGQEDIIGSRRHFQKSLQERLDRMEAALTFHLNVLVYLMAALEPSSSHELIADAIIAAKQDGEVLLREMGRVRELKR